MRGDRLRYTEPFTGTELPRLEARRGPCQRMVLFTTYGRRYVVQDYAYGPPHAAEGKWRRLPTPTSWADCRVFTARDGSVAVYWFGRGELRWLDPYRPERIERQAELAVPIEPEGRERAMTRQ